MRSARYAEVESNQIENIEVGDLSFEGGSWGVEVEV